MAVTTKGIGFDIKRTLDGVQTDLDTVTAGEIGTGAVTEPKLGTASVATAKISGNAVTIAKVENTRIVDGMMVYQSGSDLWVEMSGGTVFITGAATTFCPDAVAADGFALATIATTGCEKVAILEVSGDGKLYIKDGTEVTLNANTGTYPTVDTGCIKIANLGYPVSGGTSKHPIYEDESDADQLDNFGLESSNDIQRW